VNYSKKTREGGHVLASWRAPTWLTTPGLTRQKALGDARQTKARDDKQRALGELSRCASSQGPSSFEILSFPQQDPLDISIARFVHVRRWFQYMSFFFILFLHRPLGRVLRLVVRQQARRRPAKPFRGHAET